MLGVNVLPSFGLLEKTQFVPRYRYDAEGNRVDNITYWALKRFTAHYADEIGKGKSARKITKEDIVHYC